MPVERRKFGRAYTQRETVAIIAPMTPADTAALNLPKVSIQQPGPAYLYRIETVLERARALLEEKGMPLEPGEPIYADKSWRRKNERTSPEWYAITLIATGRNLRLFVDRGDAETAVGCALDFGELMTEAAHIAYTTDKTAQAAKEKALVQRLDVEQTHDAWRQWAAGFWATNSTLSATEVAKRIDKRQQRTIRRVITALKPDRAKK